MRTIISSQQQCKCHQQKRKRLVGPSCACLTSQQSIDILEKEAQSKKQRLLEKEEKIKAREKNKIEDERIKEWKAVKKTK